MALELEKQTLDIPCGGCGKKMKETIGRLKRNPNLTCPKCKAVTTVNPADLNATIEGIEKAVAELGETLKKAFK